MTPAQPSDHQTPALTRSDARPPAPSDTLPDIGSAGPRVSWVAQGVAAISNFLETVKHELGPFQSRTKSAIRGFS